MLKTLKYLGFVLVILASCKKDPIIADPNNSDNGFSQSNSVDINVTNVVGNQLLAMNTQTYLTENLDTFTITRYRYYISNIKLYRDDNFVFAEPESYHLLDQADTSTCKFTIQNVPFGNYTKMEFIIGVDSSRNCDGAQTGALSPTNDMFWSWSQGYIFAKMEGTCNLAPGGGFFYHVGGFTGIYNAIVTPTINFGSTLMQVDADHHSKLFLKADVLEWFKNPTIIDIVNYGAVAGGKKAKELAVNYSDMFSLAAVKHE